VEWSICHRSRCTGHRCRHRCGLICQCHLGPPATDGGASITAYNVTLLDSAGNPVGTQTVAGDVSSATFPGLTNGQTYRFKVSATNLLGTGPDSALSNVVTVAAPATTTAPVVSLTVPSGPVAHSAPTPQGQRSRSPRRTTPEGSASTEGGVV